MSKTTQFLSDCEAGISSHRANVAVLKTVLGLASLHDSNADMGAAFLEEAGGDYEKAAERIRAIDMALKQITYEWLLATRIEYLEKQGDRK